MTEPALDSRIDLAGAPRPGSIRQLAASTALADIGYIVLIAGALTGRPWIFALGALTTVAGEALLTRRPHLLAWLAEGAGFGPGARALLRGLLAITLIARCGAGGGSLTVAAIGWCALVVLLAAGQLAIAGLGWLRKSPLLSRQLDLGPVRVPHLPRGPLQVNRWVPLFDAPLLLAAVAVARSGSPAGDRGWLVAACVLAVGGAGVELALLGLAVGRTRAARLRTRVATAIQEGVRRLQPDVVLYHSGDGRSAYQIDAWAPVLEQLGRPALIAVRHAAVLDAMRPTTVPTICITPATMVADFDFGGAEVAFLVGNGSGNIHLFRRHDLAFVFLGHGDSDKATSATPLARVYDQIWVSGAAARERYQRAGVQLAPGVITEVGRPQLAELARLESAASAGRNAGPKTVLYAPTWEGWGDERYVASLATVGVELIRRLLADPALRVVYRPHPLTGTRDPALHAADRQIVALLRAAGATETTPAQPPESIWAAGTHVVVRAGWPGLLDCFAHADLLISDISALLSDWLATDRPYVVLNPANPANPASPANPADSGDLDDLSDADFVQAHPTTAGATIIDSTLAGLAQVLADLHRGWDPERDLRRTLADEVLGPRPADPVQPFRAALDALLAARRAAGS